MTVCIAAMARDHIVAVSDTMIAGGTISTDGNTNKQESIAPNWLAMFSGNDISPALPITHRVMECLKERSCNLGVVRSCLKSAFKQQLSELAADRVLSQFGLDMATFLESGKDMFDEGTFGALCAELRAVVFDDLQFLVYGFDDDKQPHIFNVHRAGEDTVLNNPGFGAIGSGSYAADTILYYLNQSRKCSLEESIANVCAAKFVAERAQGVGTATSLFVKRHGSIGFEYKTNLVERLRKEWENAGAPRTTERAVGIVKEAEIQIFSDHSSAMSS